jgi:hypothetical protein
MKQQAQAVFGPINQRQYRFEVHTTVQPYILALNTKRDMWAFRVRFRLTIQPSSWISAALLLLILQYRKPRLAPSQLSDARRTKKECLNHCVEDQNESTPP